MRKTCHICLSSHHEVMFRNDADFVAGFNCLALAALKTESRLLADGFLTTHFHSAVQTDCSRELMKEARYSYTRYFNAKYSRKGRLGERLFFVSEIEGFYHTTTVMNYVIRQGIHHGLSSTPFAYPHCSANAYFRKDLGKSDAPHLLQKGQRYKYLPERAAVPDSFRMTENGLLLREDVIDTAYVEALYITPRNFLFQMNKLSNEKDVQEQRNENDTPPVTLDSVEKGVPDFDLKKALMNEQGRISTIYLTDTELCNLIDNELLLPRYGKSSIYLLSEQQRSEIGNLLYSNKALYPGKLTSAPQIKRCLAL